MANDDLLPGLVAALSTAVSPRNQIYVCSHPQTFSEKVGEISSLPRLLQCYSSPNPATLQRRNFWKRCAVVSRFL